MAYVTDYSSREASREAYLRWLSLAEHKLLRPTPENLPVKETLLKRTAQGVSLRKQMLDSI